jgi:hypothetical protein
MEHKNSLLGSVISWVIIFLGGFSASTAALVCGSLSALATFSYTMYKWVKEIRKDLKSK